VPEHLLQIAVPWLEQYGYAILFFALFLENLGIPAPALTFLIASVLLASRGEMHLVPIIALALAGTLSGCQLAFLIGRTNGRRFLLRTGLLNRHHLRRLHRLFDRWGPPLLVIAPFVDGTRQYGSLAAGTANMGWRRFTLYNLTGVVLWIGSWSIATDVLGHHLEPVLGIVHGSGPWILGGVVTALLVVLLVRLIRQYHAPLRSSLRAGLAGRFPAEDRRHRLREDHSGKTVIMGATSYAVLAFLISIPFWSSG